MNVTPQEIADFRSSAVVRQRAYEQDAERHRALGAVLTHATSVWVAERREWSRLRVLLREVMRAGHPSEPA
ncbi:MAG: hypothetical protein IT175_06030 [Acidobacteria bacterium]|nr:hypothetical protein [Acidobacteriota bacterium]